jgi:predicted ATPase
MLAGEAIQTAEQTNERFFQAELHRLRAQMHLMLGRGSEAEAELQQALAIARRQQARLWELRSATALAQEWKKQGRYADACILLQPIYSFFAEGFDTADLKNAKALLDELGGLAAASTSVRSAVGSSEAARAS